MATIIVKTIQNTNSISAAHMGEMKFMGTVSSTHYYHGIFNLSQITILLKYPDSSIIQSIRKVCIRYLNKLVKVVRLHSKRYWLKAVTEPEIYFIKPVEYETEQGIKKSGFHMGGVETFPIQHFEQKDVASKIHESLRDSSYPESYELLMLNALGDFNKSQYNLSVIIAHNTLEIYLESYLRDILGEKYGREQLESKFEKLWDGERQHKKIRRIFYVNASEEKLLQNQDSYRSFDSSRKSRKLAVHKNYRLKEKDALDAIQNIFRFVGYLNDNKRNVASNLLLNY
jgi:hypothetical protein